MVKMMKVPILGIVENMSGFICPKCGSEFDLLGSGGGEKLSQETGVPILARIPIDPMISSDSDIGRPFVVEHKNSPATKIFEIISEKIINQLKKDVREE